MDRKPYPRDLSDAEWELIAPHIPDAELGGRPREADMREVLNAMFYVLKSGIQWDMLPHDFPPKARFITTTTLGVKMAHGNI